jgi:hypothetical protein
MNNLNWIVPSIATLLAATLTIVFSKKIKERVKSFRLGNINLKKSQNNNIQIITNQNDNESKGDYNSEQTVIAHHRIFELTDGLMKLATDAFRPVKFNDPKSFADYLNEIIDKYNEYVLYFDSKEILFDSDVVKVVHEIRGIVLKCIQHQKTIENFKSMKMPWEYITPEIEALNEIYDNQVEKELPKLRERLKEIIKNK